MRHAEPHSCQPITTGFFRKRKEVCLCSTTFVYIRQLLATTKTTTADIFAKKPLKVDHCDYFSSVRLYRQVLLLVLVQGDDNDCVFLGSIFLWMAVLRLSLPLACARPPS